MLIGGGDGAVPAIGAVVDRRYQVKREIAVGGMSRVLEAEHAQLGSRIALKVPLPSGIADPEIRLRLFREGQALTRVRHSGVPTVHDAGVDPLSGVAFLAMEMVEGKSLDGLLAARGTLEVSAACALVVQLCETLARCHAVGVVHRDIKPSNVLIYRDEDGLERPKLIDFGIAALSAREAESSHAKLTQKDELLGTFEYMSPEQLVNGDVDGRTDVWALAISLFELLTGEVPFKGGRVEVIASIVGGARVPSIAGRVPGANAALDAVLARATAAQAKDRFDGVTSMAAALRAASGARGEDVRVLPTSASPRGAEGRRHRRAAYATPLRVTLSTGAVVDGRTEDVSESGMLVVIRTPLEAGAHVDARFCLPSSGRAATVPAVVRWSRAGRGAYAAGLELVAAPDAAVADLRRFVDLVGTSV